MLKLGQWACYCSSEARRTETPTVPDYCEPLIGWRCWVVRVRTSRLVSRQQTWEPYEPLTAEHRENGYGPAAGGSLRCPGSPCDLKTRHGKGCGVYAFKSEGVLRNERSRHPPLLANLTTTGEVIGRVALWGTIVEHEHGYRAQYAYPLEFVYANGCDGASIAAVYGISFKEEASWTSVARYDELWLNPYQARFLSNSRWLQNRHYISRPRFWNPAPLQHLQPPAWASPYILPPDDLSLIKKPGRCDRAPKGWRCTRRPGHDGPCAAVLEQPSFHLHRPIGWWKDGRSGLWMRTEQRGVTTQGS